MNILEKIDKYLNEGVTTSKKDPIVNIFRDKEGKKMMASLNLSVAANIHSFDKNKVIVSFKKDKKKLVKTLKKNGDVVYIQWKSDKEFK